MNSSSVFFRSFRLNTHAVFILSVSRVVIDPDPGTSKSFTDSETKEIRQKKNTGKQARNAKQL